LCLNKYQSSSQDFVNLEEFLIQNHIDILKKDYIQREPLFYAIVKDDDHENTTEIDPIEPLMILLKTKDKFDVY
jgi:hypothetical protein